MKISKKKNLPNYYNYYFEKKRNKLIEWKKFKVFFSFLVDSVEINFIYKGKEKKKNE